MEAIEIKVPLSEEELRKLMKGRKKRGAWSKLLGIARNAPEFKEEDRVDARL
ncbi:hypothetical protein [Thermococcus sp.]|uniref:hypothetical protein n=1 Tax=Thermococcus sp. TaxID=35749 RepID=UPI00260D4AB2|nr:hypothetical protein [Thermococcus sp.]